MMTTVTPGDATRVPLATAKATWQLRNAWAATSRAKKASQRTARKWALSLTILGAAAGSVSTLVPSEATLVVQVFALASAILLALAGYTARKLLTGNRESDWSRARIASEALQREVWLYLMRVPPYDDAIASATLEQRAGQLVANIGLNRSGLKISGSSNKPLPEARTVDDYIAKRVRKQLAYYEETATKERAQSQWWQRVSFGVGVVGVMLGVVGTILPVVLTFVSLATTITGAMTAWILASRAGSLVGIYQDTSIQLLLLIARWQDWVKPKDPAALRAKAVDFIKQCEDVIARENEAWRAEWMGEEQAKQAAEAQQDVLEEVADTLPSSSGNRTSAP